MQRVIADFSLLNYNKFMEFIGFVKKRLRLCLRAKVVIQTEKPEKTMGRDFLLFFNTIDGVN